MSESTKDIGTGNTKIMSNMQPSWLNDFAVENGYLMNRLARVIHEKSQRQRITEVTFYGFMRGNATKYCNALIQELQSLQGKKKFHIARKYKASGIHKLLMNPPNHDLILFISPAAMREPKHGWYFMGGSSMPFVMSKATQETFTKYAKDMRALRNELREIRHRLKKKAIVLYCFPSEDVADWYSLTQADFVMPVLPANLSKRIEEEFGWQWGKLS